MPHLISTRCDLVQLLLHAVRYGVDGMTDRLRVVVSPSTIIPGLHARDIVSALIGAGELKTALLPMAS
jgi:hypothetical protein